MNSCTSAEIVIHSVSTTTLYFFSLLIRSLCFFTKRFILTIVFCCSVVWFILAHFHVSVRLCYSILFFLSRFMSPLIQRKIAKYEWIRHYLYHWWNVNVCVCVLQITSFGSSFHYFGLQNSKIIKNPILPAEKSLLLKCIPCAHTGIATRVRYYPMGYIWICKMLLCNRQNAVFYAF